MSQTPSLAEVLKEAIRASRLELHTAIPGLIESWDADTGLADIRVGVQTYAPQESGEMKARAHAILPSVPCAIPSGGEFRMAFPFKKDDPVEVIFQEASIDIWLEKGGANVDPEDRRRHHIADCVFIPGPRPKGKRWSSMSADAASMGHDEGPQIVWRSDKIELGGDADNAPTDAIALASKVMTELRALKNTLNSFVQTYGTHTHTVSTAGSPVAHTGTTMPPASPAQQAQDPGEVKSTTILAK